MNPNTVVVCKSVGDTACRKNTCVNLFEDKGGVKLATSATCTMVDVPDAKKQACDDGDPCTVGDVCNGKGGCAAGTDTCACQSDEDCLASDDGDLCNGVPYCDKSTPGKHVCKPNPASQVFCPQNVNTQCLQNQCNPKDGKCGLKPFPGVKACTDGDPCTKEGCSPKWGCQSVPVSCDDNDPCTFDQCIKSKGCVYTTQANGSPCDDNMVCKLGKGTCTDKGCSVAGVGIPSGCSQLKPTGSCVTTKAEAQGKLDSYIGPVWFTVDGKPSLETCDMPAGGFWQRTTFA